VRSGPPAIGVLISGFIRLSRTVDGGRKRPSVGPAAHSLDLPVIDVATLRAADSGLDRYRIGVSAGSALNAMVWLVLPPGTNGFTSSWGAVLAGVTPRG
jgi:hypothetical protein